MVDYRKNIARPSLYVILSNKIYKQKGKKQYICRAEVITSAKSVTSARHIHTLLIANDQDIIVFSPLYNFEIKYLVMQYDDQ
jgi:hypothetical protein